MALGCEALSVVWLVAREALILVVAGSLVGVAISTVAARLLSSYLFGVSPADPIALITAGMFMLLIAAIAVSLPALRATRVDPLSALRHD
jgi:ABC-type antimicrobial peptide transport system permease subunit